MYTSDLLQGPLCRLRRQRRESWGGVSGGLHGEVFCLVPTLEPVILSEAKNLRLCEKASGRIESQAPQHDADHGERDPGFFAAGEQLVVLGQAPPSAEPSQGTFDHPAPRQHLEAGGPTERLGACLWWGPDPALATVGVCHNLDLAAQFGLHPLGKAATLVATIRPDQLQAGKDPAQRRQQQFASLLVLDVGFMHELVQDQSVGIYQDVAFASLDLLAAVVAAGPPFCVVLAD
jgi:hypothetical protein